MRMAAEQNVDVSAFALVVPMIKINTNPYDYDQIKLIASSLNALGLGKMYAPGQSQWPPLPLEFGKANGCNSNPDTAQIQSAFFTLEPTLRTRGTTIKWLKETIQSTEKLLSNGYMQALKQPVILFTAGDDALVDTAVAAKFCGDLENCNTVHFPDAKHCINRESPARMSDIVRQSITHYEKVINDLKP